MFFPSFVTKLRATTQLIVELYSTVSLIPNIISRCSWKRDHCQNSLAGGALEQSGALSRVLHTAGRINARTCPTFYNEL